MKNYVAEGDIMDVVAPYARTAGQGTLVGSIFGVAVNDVALAAVGQIKTKGVFDITKTAAVNWLAGTLLYWDDAAKSITNVVAANKLVGTAVQAQVNADAIARVRLNGTFTT